MNPDHVEKFEGSIHMVDGDRKCKRKHGDVFNLVK